MRFFSIHPFTLASLCLIGMLALPCLLIPPVSAADETIIAEFGDVINLHGVSYQGDQVFLFMTGPGLPANGVTLTDISERADQGQFTIVDVDPGNQEWAMKWYTHKIENEINPGVYIVYVTNEPVDKSHLGGTSTYKTLEVDLKASTTKSSGSSTTNYVLRPEDHVTVYSPTLALNTSTPTPTPTTAPPTTQPTPVPTTIPPTTKAPLPPLMALLAAILGAGAILALKR